MFKIIFISLLMFSQVSLAKDYFGLNFSDSMQDVEAKASLIFADAVKVSDQKMDIKATGLLRFYPWLESISVNFLVNSSICSINLIADVSDEENKVKLLDHLKNDYDLKNMTDLNYRSTDIRGYFWSVKQKENKVTVLVSKPEENCKSGKTNVN